MSLLARYRRRAAEYAPWRRLWVPRGVAIDEDGRGFLAEPATGRFAVPRNQQLRTLDELDDVACVVALGDPGLGKSWELDAYANRLAARLAGADVRSTVDAAPDPGHADEVRDDVLGVNAAQLGSIEALHRLVWDADVVVRWRTGRGALHLVLDALDEAPIALDVLCDAILDALETLPVTRLRLRVGCRTAVFPAAFRDGLQRRFAAAAEEEAAARTDAPVVKDAPIGAEVLGRERGAQESAGDATEATPASGPVPPPAGSFAEVELVPLRRQDVRRWAEGRLGSAERADEFLDSVLAADVGAFAARPQTLDALLGRFAAGASLAASQAELYRWLCTRLCDPHPVRPGSVSAEQPRTTAAQRYRLVGRVAAAMLLGNRPAIWLGGAGEPPPDALTIPELTGPERADNAPFHADETALWEAVDTGVFTGAASTALATHQTFAEFLAAEWVTARELPLAQVRALLIDATDPDERVVPQLRQLAAWLAALRPDVFDAVARSEPELLLWSDVVQLPPDRRPALVEALLAARTANRLVEPPRWSRRRLAHLAHPGLAHQLAPVLADRAAPERTRDLALDLARACDTAPLAPLATELALDAAEPLALRVGAAYLVGAVGSDIERLTLAPLVEAPLLDDAWDDLRGAALRACWRLLTPDELFGVLTPLKRANYAGAYGGALLEIAHGLTGEYARAGARWLTQDAHDMAYLETLAQRVLRLALDDTEDAELSAALGAYVVGRLRRDQPPFTGRHGLPDEDDEFGVVRTLAADAALRRRVTRAVVDACPGPDAHVQMITYHPPALFVPGDFEWAVEWLAGLPAGDCRRAPLRTLVSQVFYAGDPTHVAAAFAHAADADVRSATDDVAGRFATPAAAVADAAKRRQRAHAHNVRRQAVWVQRQARRQAEEAAAAPGPLAERVVQALATSGDADVRWQAVFRELLRVDARQMWHRLTDNALAGLRGLHATAAGDGLVERAADYLRTGTVPPEPYPNRTMQWSALQAWVAFVTLHELAPAVHDALEPAVWRRWMRTLVGYWATEAEEQLHTAVLQRAVAAAPAAARDELIRHFDTAARGEHLILHHAPATIGPSVPGVGEGLARRAGRGTYPVSNADGLLGWLVAAGDATALDVARRLLRDAADGVEEDRGDGASPISDLALAAGGVLLQRAPAAAWDDLWAVFHRSDAHARALLRYAARDRETAFGARGDALTEAQLADMYRLLERLYPHETDPVHVGTFSPGSRDNLSFWRDGLLRRLEVWGTPEAVAQLEHLARREPVRDWMVQLWLRARAALHGVRWRGVAPRDLIALAEQHEARVVESGLQLLTVVEESLARLQGDLQGQWRSVVGLWNESPGGSTPKSEEHLSNEIARHLKRDLADRRVVVGRELRIQLGTPGGAGGLRTDVEVYAPARGAGGGVGDGPRVIIEVKGSWNAELLTAMRTQLVERYLAPHGVEAGLYVTGWYTCPSWKRTRAQAASARHGSRAALAAKLAEQATGLSSPLRQVRAVVLDTSLPAAAGGPNNNAP